MENAGGIIKTGRKRLRAIEEARFEGRKFVVETVIELAGRNRVKDKNLRFSTLLCGKLGVLTVRDVLDLLRGVSVRHKGSDLSLVGVKPGALRNLSPEAYGALWDLCENESDEHWCDYAEGVE
jgi:hypothetical protein